MVFDRPHGQTQLQTVIYRMLASRLK